MRSKALRFGAQRATAEVALTEHTGDAGPAAELRARLSIDLREAMRGRDRAAVAAIRSLMGALDNAEAVDAPERSSIDAPLVGLGAGDAPRRVLDDTVILRVIDIEISERIDAVSEYRRRRHDHVADRLEAEAAVLWRYRGG